MNLEQLTYYPLTGGRGIDVDERALGVSGLVTDRKYVVYDPETYERVSCKPNQAPDLLRIQPSTGDLRSILTFYDESGVQPVDRLDLSAYGRSNFGRNTISVLEFEQPTPCADMGDEPAHVLSDFLHKNVRLAEKAAVWTQNYAGAVSPFDRKNAPLHIVNLASCVAIAEDMGLDGAEVIRRFRPNIVISGAEAFSEGNWQGLVINGLTIAIPRVTLRCPVPGLDSRTGKNMKDIPKAYQGLDKALNDKGRPTAIFGVYGVPVPETLISDWDKLAVGQEVTLS